MHLRQWRGRINAPTGSASKDKSRTTAPRMKDNHPQSFRLLCAFSLRVRQHTYIRQQRGAQQGNQQPMEMNTQEVRCPKCGKLLAKGVALCMEFKCERCKTYYILRASRPNPASLDGQAEHKIVYNYG